MSSHKTLNVVMTILMVFSLLFSGITPASAQEVKSSAAPARVKSMPAGPTDETKVPHYFGPYPNWANSPFTLPDAAVEIVGDGSGATATASVGANGVITNILITNPGNGYSSATVNITGSGTGAAAEAVITASGVVTGVNVDQSGGGYKSPVVTITGGGATTAATATAYGGVDAVTLDVGGAGSGYKMPTVDFDLPDAPGGVQARAHANFNPDSGAITGIVVDNPGSGYSKAPDVIIRDGTVFDPINNAGSGATAKATLTVQYVVINTFGDGYTSTPNVSFVDATGGGSGAAATAFTDFGAVTAINITNHGSGYVTQGGIKKFQDGLPVLCDPTAGWNNCTDNNLGQHIPIAVPDTTTFTTANGFSADADYYVIALVQHREQMSSSLPASGTLLREYVQLQTPANASFSKGVQLSNDLLDGTSAPALMPDGSRAVAVDDPHFLGPVIVAQKDRAVRIVFYNLLPKDAGGDLFLPVDSTLMGSGMGPMDNMTDPKDEGLVTDMVRNPTCTDNPQAQDLMGMPVCYKNDRATLHLHGGTTPWISDGTAHQWITPSQENTTWPQGVGVESVPDMITQASENLGVPNCNAKTDGCMSFYYTNQQSARLLFYHDHAWGITRLNVYAGEAAGYVITDPTDKKLFGANGLFPELGTGTPLVIQDRTFVPQDSQLYGDPANGVYGQDPTWDASHWGSYGNLWYHHVYMPAQNPGDPSGMSAYGRWMYGPWFWPPAGTAKYQPIANPYYDPNCNLDDPSTWQYQTDPFCEPQLIPGTPNISVGMEQFNDTPLVNGTAYPTTTVQPKSYRFRVLNAANDRFWNLQWYVADPTTGTDSEVALKASEVEAAQTDPNIVPTPDTNISPAGPSWIQIGTEGGFLPAPVVVPNQPITWITDPTRFDVGNVDKHALLLAPAERADVIVDFSQYRGKTLILYNDAPAAFPARVASYDYYTGAPDMSPVGAPKILPGYGPNTRTIMQVKVADTPAANAFNLTALQNAFKHHADGSGAFESGQHPIIVGQAGYNSAYGTNFAASSWCNKPGGTVTRCDGMARISEQGGDLLGFNTLLNPNAKMQIPLQPKAIHDEMNASSFDEFGRMTANLGVEAVPANPGAQNIILYPFVNPATEFIDGTNLPSAGTKVIPISSAADGTQIWKITHNGVDTHPIHFHLFDVQVLNRVTWDNIIIPPDPNELGWKDTVRISPLEDTIVALRPVIPDVPFEVPNSVRTLNPMMPDNMLNSTMFNNIDTHGVGTANIINQLVNFGWEYVYHCHILSHEEMDMMRPVSLVLPPLKATWPTPPAPAYSVDVDGHLVLTFNDNSINETSFEIQRRDAANDWKKVAEVLSPLDVDNTHGVRTALDTTYAAGTTYQYRIVALNTAGYGAEFPTLTAQSISDSITVGTATAPAAPSNLTATLGVGPQVQLQWIDNATDETGFTIERCTGAGCNNFASIDGVGANATTYNDTTVAANTTYSYRVFAFNLSGNSAPTDPATIAVSAPPSVVSIARAAGSPNTTNAASVNFTVTFSEAVTGLVTGSTPPFNDFALTTTGNITGASVTGVSGNGTTYTVAVKTGSGNGTLRLDLIDHNTIINAAGDPLGGTGTNNYTAGEVYTIDKIVPTVTSIIRAAGNPNPTIAASVSYTVTFSEPVTGVVTGTTPPFSDFALTTTGTLNGSAITNVNGSGRIYTVVISSGSGTGTLRLDLLDQNTILDAAGNPLGGTAVNNYTTGQTYTIDRTAPTVTSIVRTAGSLNPTNAASISYTLTFSEPVKGLVTGTTPPFSDFALTTTGNITTSSDAYIASVTGTGTTYTIVVNLGSKSGTVRLDLKVSNTITDILGNPLDGAGASIIAGDVYSIDKTAPTIVSIAPTAGSPNPTDAASVSYTVTFSEPVIGVDTTAPVFSDFALHLKGGITSVLITSVDGSAATYTVTVNTGVNSGTVRLNMPANASSAITDLVGNPLGNLPFTSGEVYTIQKVPVAPVAATLSLPSSSIATKNPTYTWSDVPGSTWYYLWVDGPSGNLIKQWYTSAQAGCNGSICSVTPTTTLASGSYTWWIQTWNDAGTGPWSNAMTFSLAIPGAATLSSPNTSVGVNTPTYTWSEVPGSSWYYLWVDGPSGNVIKQWYTSAQAGCTGGTCSVTPTKALASGSHTWLVQTWNDAGTGPWSAPMSFSAPLPPLPGSTLLASPSGTIATKNPTYTWNDVPGSTSYNLWVDGPSGNLINAWYTSAQAGCNGSTCSVAGATPNLAAGTYTWKVETRNEAGTGPWSTTTTFSLAIPGAATLSSPNASIGMKNPTYTWSEVPGSSWYYLWVDGPSGNVIKQWYTSAQAGCNGSLCSVTPTTTLASGSYSWSVQTWNDAGTGSWSNTMTFSLAIPGAASLSAPNSIATNSPTYTWNDVPGSTWYYLWVNGPSGNIIKTWYSSAEAHCDGTTCWIIPATTLTSGSYTWWIQTWNDIGTGPWSPAMIFSVP